MKCIYCGGELLVQPGSRIGICTRCMAENPLPGEDAGRLYEEAGELLRANRFDEAKELYQKLLAENPNDAAVCWSMALCEYGIEYVTDPATGEQLPTLHRLSLQKFSEYLYVKKALDLSLDSLEREFYQKHSLLIDSIQVRSLSISSQETPVDVFICYKRSEEGEKRTADSRMAADYYRELTRRGYQVFFAEETLKAGEEYEPRIFAALQSAKVMIAFASRKEYYEAVWVRNEWSRYAALIEQDMKEKGSTERLLIPMFQHMSHEELPETLKSMPSYVEMAASQNPRNELLGLVASHFERGKAENVSSILREVRGGVSGGSKAAAGGVSGNAGAAGLEKNAEKTRTLAQIRLVNGEFRQAEELFQKAIEQMGGEGDADLWLGLMMCHLKIPGREALALYASPIENTADFRKALELAGPEKEAELLRIAENCRENMDWEQSTEQKRKECRKRVNAELSPEGPVFSTWAALKKQCGEYLALQTKAAGQKGIPGLGLFIFLLLGNAVPYLCFSVWQIQGEVMPDMSSIVLMVQYVVYLVFLWRLLNRKNILNTGFVTYAIRLIAISFVQSLIFGLVLSRWLIPVTIAVVAATVICGVKVFSDPVRMRRKLAEGRQWAASSRAELRGLSERMLEDAKQRIATAAKPYQRYYRDFDTALERWEEQARKDITAKIMELQTELDRLERGNL